MPKVIQKIEFTGQLINSDGKVVANKCMFVITILGKFKETRQKQKII